VKDFAPRALLAFAIGRHRSTIAHGLDIARNAVATLPKFWASAPIAG